MDRKYIHPSNLFQILMCSYHNVEILSDMAVLRYYQKKGVDTLKFVYNTRTYFYRVTYLELLRFLHTLIHIL